MHDTQSSLNFIIWVQKEESTVYSSYHGYITVTECVDSLVKTIDVQSVSMAMLMHQQVKQDGSTCKTMVMCSLLLLLVVLLCVCVCVHACSTLSSFIWKCFIKVLLVDVCMCMCVHACMCSCACDYMHMCECVCV